MSSFITKKNNLLDPEKMQEAEAERSQVWFHVAVTDDWPCVLEVLLGKKKKSNIDFPELKERTAML